MGHSNGITGVCHKFDGQTIHSEQVIKLLISKKTDNLILGYRQFIFNSIINHRGI